MPKFWVDEIEFVYEIIDNFRFRLFVKVKKLNIYLKIWGCMLKDLHSFLIKRSWSEESSNSRKAPLDSN